MVAGLKDLPYEERMKVTKLPSLAYRRLRGDMIEVYKFLHNKYTVDTNNLFPMAPIDSKTCRHALKIMKRACKSNMREHFFTMRTVNPWNNLPHDVVMAPTVNTFKNRLDTHWNKFKYTIDPLKHIEQCRKSNIELN
jgi:ribonuclease P/MRP protein subunit RPP40